MSRTPLELPRDDQLDAPLSRRLRQLYELETALDPVPDQRSVDLIAARARATFTACVSVSMSYAP